MKKKVGLLLVLALAAFTASPKAQPPVYCNQQANISISAAIGITQIIAAPSSSFQNIRVCGFTLNAGDGIRTFTGTDPAAGAQISETVPANARWKLLSVQATLATDANVANRRTHLFWDDGTIELFRVVSQVDHPASITWAYNWANSFSPSSSSSAGSNAWLSMPNDILLSASSRIQTALTSGQAGDNWSAPRISIQEWTTFKFVDGTGVNCASGTADRSGQYYMAPGSNLAVAGSLPVMFATSNAALCISNLRPTTISGTIHYVTR